MKFSITLDEQEREDVFGKNPSREFDLVINGRKFACVFDYYESNLNSDFWCIRSRPSYEITISGCGQDKKAQELAQAKAEVNRTKEAHKEAQRKLSALMEDKT